MIGLHKHGQVVAFTFLVVAAIQWPGFSSLALAQQIHDLPSIAGDCDSCSANQCTNANPHDCQSTCRQTCRGGRCGACTDNWRAYFDYEPQLYCPGDTIYQTINSQIANGRTAQLVFYSFHFQWNPQMGAWQLTQSGWNNVYRLSRILPLTPGSVVVPTSGDTAEDDVKLQLVSDALSHYGLHDASIVIGHVNGTLHGLPGVEAGDVFQRRLLGSPYAGRTSGRNVTLSRGAGSSAAPGPGGNRR